MKLMNRIVVLAACGLAATAGGASAEAAQPASASPVETFRLVDLGSSLEGPSAARQQTDWTYHYAAPKMRCAIGGTGEGRQRIDFFAPRRITLLRMRVNGPPAWIDTPATMTRTGHYTADIGALPPGCPPDFGYGGTYPVEHGGCGTVSGTLHLGFRLLANPRARGHQQLEFLGRFTSPLGATMFSVCIPSPPGPVADGRLLPATFRLTEALAGRFLSTAEPARIHWFRGNPEGSTVSVIRAELDHLDPSAPCVRHSCGF